LAENLPKVIIVAANRAFGICALYIGLVYSELTAAAIPDNSWVGTFELVDPADMMALILE
jgi:hypothetical protein